MNSCWPLEMRAPTSALRCVITPETGASIARVAKIETALFKCRLGSLSVCLLALDVGLADGHLQGRAALRLLELALLLRELGHALFHRLLRRSDGRLVRGDGLDLRGGGRLVLVVVRARDLLLVEESLVPGKISLVPLVDGLRLLELGHCAVQVMLRRGERGLGSDYLSLLLS